MSTPAGTNSHDLGERVPPWLTMWPVSPAQAHCFAWGLTKSLHFFWSPWSSEGVTPQVRESNSRQALWAPQSPFPSGTCALKYPRAGQFRFQDLANGTDQQQSPGHPLGDGSCLCPEAILPTNLPLSGCMEPCLSWEREEQRQEVFIWIPSTEASLTPSLEPSLDFTGLSCRLCMSGPPRAVQALPWQPWAQNPCVAASQRNSIPAPKASIDSLGFPEGLWDDREVQSSPQALPKSFHPQQLHVPPLSPNFLPCSLFVVALASPRLSKSACKTPFILSQIEATTGWPVPSNPGKALLHLPTLSCSRGASGL